jgi:fructose-1,6-bisphosphatase/inositol monophosphatase family enzyme
VPDVPSPRGAVAPPDPLFLATAIEAVLEAGRVQLEFFGRDDLRIDKKGAIDLVTEADLAVERGFRAFIAERFPDHAVLAEELGAGDPARHCWVFDPIDGTTNFAHGLPIFSASLALEIDGEVAVGAIYDPSRRELFTAERGGGAYLNGRRLQVTPVTSLIDALLLKLPGVSGKKINQLDAYFVSDKMFACISGKGVGLRLPAAVATELQFSRDDVEPFQPGGSASSREWIQIDHADAAEYANDLALFQASLDFVKAGRSR